VANCTGPETDSRKIDHVLLSSLLPEGLVTPDPLHLGLEVDVHGNLIREEGRPSEMLYAIGALRKAALWEPTAVPEIRNQCSDLAERLIPQLIQRATLQWEI
jgi:uncharacterized NAD(P)/FAD-binding protein YdhS